MFSKKFFDFIFGSIKFNAEKGFRELFLSECKKRNISLGKIRINEDGLSAQVKYNEIKAALEAAKTSGMEIKTLKIRGLPYFLLKYKKRAGIPLGIIIFAVISVFLFSAVWSVDIKGNEKISEEDIRDALEYAGVYTGALKKNINCNETEFILQNKLKDILFVAVNIAGSRVYVDIKEVKEASETADKNGFCNIIAAKSGEIVKADIFEGKGKLEPGTPVIKGDMLVNGVIALNDGSVRFVNSKAKIIARTKNFVSGEMQRKKNICKVSESKNKYTFRLFGVFIPLGLYKNNEIYSESEYLLDGGDIIFPCGIIRKNMLTFEEGVDFLTPSETALAALSHFSENAVTLYKDAKILESSFHIDGRNGYSIKAQYICEEDIALQKSFSVDSEENCEL